MQLCARGRRFPAPAGGESVYHAQQCAGRQLLTDLEPWVELIPCPAVHPDFAPFAGFPASNEHVAAAAVKIALLEGERFADRQPGAPQQHDERANPLIALGSERGL